MKTNSVAPHRGLGRPGLALAAGFALLIASLAGVIVMGWRFADAQRWVQHTIEVRLVIQSVSAAVHAAEAGQRNYLVTDDAAYAAESERDQRKLAEQVARLTALTADNPVQRARLETFAPLLEQRLSLINEGISHVRAGRREDATALASRGRGKSLMMQIEEELAAIDQEEARLFELRQQGADSERRIFTVMISLTIAVGIALAVMALTASRRYAGALKVQNESLLNEIRQREEAESQLRQAQKMESLGRLTGGIAHDFNNMLAIIVGNVEAILRRVDQGPDRLRPLANNALEGAKRAGVLTQRLLAFSRQMPLSPKTLDANRVVNSIMDMLNRALGERVVVETVLGAGVWRIFADESQLESALLNLAVNARDAMPDGGKLTIETTNAFLDDRYAREHTEVTPGQYVLISVTDNGHGMTSDIIAKAFDPFFTTKPAGAGTGLGLSQVHGFLKQSGGHIKIYSEPRVGSTIKLYFPRYAGADDVREDDAPTPASAPIGCKVLLVEDDSGVRSFVASALAELQCDVIEAEDAQSALRQLEAHKDVTVLLTDVVMPGKTGRQLADAALEMRPRLKVLYMTGYTRNAIVHNGMLDSGTHLLTKPFTFSELELQLNRLLRSEA